MGVLTGKVLNLTLRGYEFKLQTRPGVFAKNGLDEGSAILIDKMEIADNTLVADLGSGSGVIGFAAAKLNPHGHVHLLDVNLRMVELAKANAELNNLNNAEVYLSDLFSAVENRTYHLILSNPPQHLGSDFLDEAVRECFRHLKPGGQVMWVVQEHLKQFTEKLFIKTFKNCETIFHGKEFALLTASRRK